MALNLSNDTVSMFTRNLNTKLNPLSGDIKSLSTSVLSLDCNPGSSLLPDIKLPSLPNINLSGLSSINLSGLSNINMPNLSNIKPDLKLPSLSVLGSKLSISASNFLGSLNLPNIGGIRQLRSIFSCTDSNNLIDDNLTKQFKNLGDGILQDLHKLGISTDISKLQKDIVKNLTKDSIVGSLEKRHNISSTLSSGCTNPNTLAAKLGNTTLGSNAANSIVDCYKDNPTDMLNIVDTIFGLLENEYSNARNSFINSIANKSTDISTKTLSTILGKSKISDSLIKRYSTQLKKATRKTLDKKIPTEDAIEIAEKANSINSATNYRGYNIVSISYKLASMQSSSTFTNTGTLNDYKKLYAVTQVRNDRDVLKMVKKFI